MDEVTIIKVGGTLVVPIQVELHDKAAMKLQQSILRKIEKSGAQGLLIDVSAVSIVDSFLGRLLGETAKMARLMGTTTILVGMRKEVVLTLVQLGMTLNDLCTSLNVEEGLRFLDTLLSGTPPADEGGAV
ncbi:STAS domain-containing protein [Geobacter sp. SVR]|uniref:STAS domain-containing protein n=1 Tax=Geobacter sp. SVR TaxID=2495594 RepID=UPI00143EF65D|nr:STAS domain-containing protein [Geobacter sp. SVR]BCS52010.1 anti-sigma factor antagonist [Geobacter sp. SVR]GCF87176.1 anti-sigma factor antagonist [Geobacter sp. SVR]